MFLCIGLTLRNGNEFGGDSQRSYKNESSVFLQDLFSPPGNGVREWGKATTGCLLHDDWKGVNLKERKEKRKVNKRS